MPPTDPLPTNTPQDATVRTGGADSIPSGAPPGSPERKANARVLKRKAAHRCQARGFGVNSMPNRPSGRDKKRWGFDG